MLGHPVYCKHDAGSYSPDDEEWLDLESDYWRAAIVHSEPEGERSYSEDHLPAIEFGRAWEIFYRRRSLYSCRDCEPLVTKFEAEWCDCTFFEHFVEERWVCIPCLLVEERKALGGRRVTGPDGRVVRSMLTNITIEVLKAIQWYRCSCGKPTPTDGVSTCRICGHYEFKAWWGARIVFNPYGTDAHTIMSMQQVIREQLSGTVTSNAEDPVLGQLG